MINKINLKDLKEGDVFSESSHYIYKGKGNGGKHILTHVESNETVELGEKYITDLLDNAEQYQEEVKVGKEDKKDGTLGIRSIFEGIHSAKVFSVCFRKQDKVLSAKKIKELKEGQILMAISNIEDAQKNKKGVAEVAKNVIKLIQDNPVLPIEQGDLRILKGYKVQFESRDGRYDCVDMEINQLRPVNINTIEFIIIDGIKYIVE